MTHSLFPQSTKAELPMPVGTRIVSHPFDHYGKVGPNSSPTICEVLLDEPLKHTDRVWSQWDEIQREGEYAIETQREYVMLAERDVRDAVEAVNRADERLRKARKSLREVQDKYLETVSRYG